MRTTRRRLIAFAALAGAAIATQPVLAADTFVNVLTGGTSGVYYPLGVAIAKVITDKVPGTRPSVQATKGSVENLNLIQAGRGEIGFTLGDSLAGAVAGDADLGFRAKADKVRVLAAIYPNYVQIVAARDSGIKTLADLKGKRLSVGAPKSGTEVNARTILAGAGLGYGDLGKVEYLDFGQSVELIKNRQLDATLQSAGLGVASIRDLAVSVPTTVVEVPPDLVAKVGAPYLSAPIPAKTYEGQTADVMTAAIPNYLVTRADLPDDLVYQMTKAIFENLDQLHAAHSASKGMTLAGAVKNPVAPIHPGAAKYYAEKGIK
jgi:TRAP transporter TAXI family solute receptor